MAKKRADSADSDGVRSSQVRAQYDALKRQHPGRVLLFQLGDFYETFESDAVIVARVCDITLTSRELSRGDRVPLAGVPIHRAAPHIGKLVAAGYHVAICDQVSEPGKGLVERAVTRVVTPGTVAEPGLVSPHENNLIVALAVSKTGTGLAAADVTTGELQTTVVEGAGPHADALLTAELQRLAPAECLISETGAVSVQLPGHTTTLPSTRFEPQAAADTLRRLFKVGSLDGYGLPGDSPALCALGALVGYVGENNHRLLASLREPKPYIVGSHLALDPVTRRNLELTRTARHGQARGSLLHAVDRTRTPMGARRLRRLLGQPLVDRLTLESRLDALALLVEDGQRRGRLRATLAKLGDIERLIGRVRQATATPREVAVLAQALRLLPELPAELADIAEAGGLLGALAATIDGCPALAGVIERTLAEPGGPRIIQQGHSQELDELVDGMGEARRWLAQLERRERERTGIRSLKVGFNRVFGYYLEVTRSNLSSVPVDYQRRQSLVSAERFVTPELKEREALILTAEARVEELETELFQALLRKIAEQAGPIVASVEAVADLDVLAGLADVAADRGWCRPEFADDDQLVIRGGRHPVLEAMAPGGDVVPNDCAVGGRGGGAAADQTTDAGRLLIVTGPNMGGKSTYLRMVALVVLLAQVGSFVPASEARIGLADRLFTRVGSEDDLTAGASTFLVEMAETASILRQATPRSLVVLDEVGRGTSTHDGLCIAQAVLEHLHDEIGARTLFATHFHELTALAQTLTAVRNVTVAVDDRDGQLAFLYRVTPGAADRSYGVQVARLAGLPASVTERAALLLALREGDLVDLTPLTLRPEDRGDLTVQPRRGDLTPPTPLFHELRGPSASPDPRVGAERGEVGQLGTSQVLDGTYVEAVNVPLRRVAEDSPASDAYSVNSEARHDVSTPLPLSAPEMMSAKPIFAPRSGLGGEVSPAKHLGGEVSSAALGGEVSPEVAPVSRQLLADLLGLDLGNLTPIQALNLLHQWQTAARDSVPWHAWLASLTEER